MKVKVVGQKRENNRKAYKILLRKILYAFFIAKCQSSDKGCLVINRSIWRRYKMERQTVDKVFEIAGEVLEALKKIFETLSNDKKGE